MTIRRFPPGRRRSALRRRASVERRAVKLGLSNAELLEVTEGLEEGDEVVADVTHIEDYAELVDKPEPPAGDPHTIASSHPPEVVHKHGL